MRMTIKKKQFASKVEFVKKFNAFSLLELMVVFAIILIISLVSYPVLTQYYIKSKVTDVLQAVTPIQSMITNNIASNGSVTGSGLNLTTPTTVSKYLDSLSVDEDGTISITTTADAGSISLTLSPEYNTTVEQVSWTCAVTNVSMNQSVPVECRI